MYHLVARHNHAMMRASFAVCCAGAHDGIRGLVLSPTRELAHQTVREAKKYAAGLSVTIAMLSKANITGAPKKKKEVSASECNRIA